MNRKSLDFLVVFLVTAGTVFYLVRNGRPGLACLVGIVGILVHWYFARSTSEDEEDADAS